MKAVHFGAGNIGRGFIGLMLTKSGYEVCFVARNEKQVALLKQRKHYPVALANRASDTSVVSNFTAINIKHTDEVAEAVASADLVTTAVGVSALKNIAESIARGLELRLRKPSRPLHIIACENALGGSSLLKEQVYARLSPLYHEAANRYIAFPDAAVDRIVPLQEHDDPLKVTVEPYFEWVIDRSMMIEGFHEIPGVHYVDSLGPYIERKLFTVNTGHCAAAYHGYLAGYDTIHETMRDPLLQTEIRKVMQETGNMLIHKYNWEPLQHQGYIRKILDRFMNSQLQDRVVRVGRSPLRKLSIQDRLVQPALQAHEMGLRTNHLASAMAAALLFDYEKDPEAVKLQKALHQKGVHQVISGYMGVPVKHPLHQKIAKKYVELKQRQYGVMEI